MPRKYVALLRTVNVGNRYGRDEPQASWHLLRRRPKRRVAALFMIVETVRRKGLQGHLHMKQAADEEGVAC